jgi:hypothetical protein
MGLKTDTFFDDRAARRNRWIYVGSALVVAGCAAAFFLLSNQGTKKPRTPEPNPPDRIAKEPGSSPAPNPDAPRTIREEPTPVRPDRPKPRGPLAEADLRFEEGMSFLRESRDLGPGSKEGAALKHKALEGFLFAQKAYEAWLEAHPEDESRYDAKLADIRRQVFWTRKNMAATEFPDGGGDEPPPGEPEPEPEPRPSRPVHVPRPPTTERRPTLPPDRLLHRFEAATRKALRDGRPRPLVEEGRELLKDERLAEQHDRIRTVVDGASAMVAFLDAAAGALEKQKNRMVALELKSGRVAGVVTSVGESVVLKLLKGEATYPIEDLSAKTLLELATAAEFLTSGYGHRAAGAYLFWRGDRDEAFEQLLRARALGEDVSAYQKPLEEALRRSEPLRALADWLVLETRLGKAEESTYPLIRDFCSKHRGTGLFRDHREELFRAAAEVARQHPYDVKHLFVGQEKFSGNGKVKLEYSFDDAAEMRDFDHGKTWRIESGRLVGEKETIWLERLDLTNADVSFTLPYSMAAVVGLWTWDRRGAGGVNLFLTPEPGRLVIDLRRGNRSLGKETVRLSDGPLEFDLKRREEKYQVRLNRKLVIKATDLERHNVPLLNAVGISARNGPVEIEDLSVSTAVDMDWAKSGGRHYASWILDWFVSRPFPVPPKGEKLALDKPEWPETEPFDPSSVGEDGKPRWFPVTSPKPWFNLGRVYKGRNNAVAYVATRVWSPKKQNAVLEIMVDDRARAFLNGEPVSKEIPLHELQRLPVKLKEGDNVLLLKVYQAGGAWQIISRFLTKDGGPMRELSCW